MFEALENRQMFSVTVAVDPASTQTTNTTPQPTATADIQVTKKTDATSSLLMSETLVNWKRQ